MNFNLSLFLQNKNVDTISTKLDILIKDATLKDIANILNDLKILSKENSLKNLSTQKEILQYINELKNFKPSLQNLPILKNILENISKNLPKDFSKKGEIEKKIKKISTLIKDTISFKDIRKNIISLKNEMQTIPKNIKNEPNIKNFSKKIDNFLKLINKDANTDKKELHSAFKDIIEHFDKIKKVDNFKNIIPQKVSSVQKHIDTISTLLNLQYTQKKDIKNLETFLKEVIVTHKKDKVNLIGKPALIKNIENITKNINTISLNLPNEKKYLSAKMELKNFIQSIQDINLEKNIRNSGVFYEAKLLDNTLDNMTTKKLATEDVKAILLKLKGDESLKEYHQLNSIIDKTINQINTIQTNALLTQSLFTYIPFGWDNLKDGSLTISNLKKKDNFSCKIELDLENYGKVDVMMLFTEEKLSLNLDIKNEKFKNLLQVHKLELKKALEDIGYNTTIFFSKQNSSKYNLQADFETDMGMDIKI